MALQQALDTQTSAEVVLKRYQTLLTTVPVTYRKAELSCISKKGHLSYPCRRKTKVRKEKQKEVEDHIIQSRLDGNERDGTCQTGEGVLAAEARELHHCGRLQEARCSDVVQPKIPPFRVVSLCGKLLAFHSDSTSDRG